MKWIKLIILVLFFSSCDSYYYITNVEDIYLYNSPNNDGFEKDLVLISAGTYYYSTIKNKRFRKAKFGNTKGYVYNPYFKNPSYKSNNPISQSSSSTIRNTSQNYSSSRKSSYRPKTVNVKGYYRKNGTYVKPHTRSAPRKR